MAESKSGIGYAVYIPERDVFLGKMGAWYSDVRLAAVYSESRAAKMAAARSEASWATAVVEITLTVTAKAIEFPVAQIAKHDGTEPVQESAVKPGNVVKPAPKAPAKAA